MSYTLGPEAGWRVAGWAGPEASRRHVRHASRRAGGLGLKLVSGWHILSFFRRRRRQEVKAWPAWAELLGQPDWGAGARPVSDT